MNIQNINRLLLLLLLYFKIIKPKLGYASIEWNSVNFTGSRKLERIHMKFVALC
jgi:hypothetical protein